MKLFFGLVFGFLLSSITFGQSNKLPEILIPSDFGQSEAERLNARVFKILPRGTYENPEGTYKDEENAIGIRQGGSYYSFTKLSHSYNKVPQIKLEQKLLQVGFYGGNYGFITDLGNISLTDVSDKMPAATFLLGYTPPKYYKEIYEQAEQRRNVKENGFSYLRYLPAVAGHSYLLRSISFDEADNLVALQIIKANEDGSLEIAWKPVKEFAVPKMLRQTDEEISIKISSIWGQAEYSDVKFTVTDNIVVLSGSIERSQLARLISVINNDVRPSSIQNKITVK